MIKEFLHFCNPSAMAFDHLFISELLLIILRQFVIVLAGIFMHLFSYNSKVWCPERKSSEEINRHWSGCAMDKPSCMIDKLKH